MLFWCPHVLVRGKRASKDILSELVGGMARKLNCPRLRNSISEIASPKSLDRISRQKIGSGAPKYGGERGFICDQFGPNCKTVVDRFRRRRGRAIHNRDSQALGVLNPEKAVIGMFGEFKFI